MQYAASFVGWSNTGKTRLIRRLTADFSAKGYQVGALKQGHCGPDFESRGKDTDLFFESGAARVGFVSPQGGFIRYREPPGSEEFRAQFALCDILLIEGLWYADIPCFELIESTAHLADTKFPPQKLTAYIDMRGDTGEYRADLGQPPVLPGAVPELILQFLEELWNARSL